MKKLLSLIITIIYISNLFAQDTIRLRSGEKILAQVQEIGISEIRYKKWSNLEGPTYVKSKLEVLSIQYNNGTTDFLGDSSISIQQASMIPNYADFNKLSINKHSETQLSLGTENLTELRATILMGESKYADFKRSRRKMNNGTCWNLIGCFVLGSGIGLTISGWILDDLKNVGIGAATGSVGLIMMIGGTVAFNRGKKDSEAIIDEYNNIHSPMSSVSLNWYVGLTSSGLALSF